MAPRTPQRIRESEPFMTFSFSKDGATKLSQSFSESAMSVNTSPVIDSSKAKNPPRNKSSNKRSSILSYQTPPDTRHPDSQTSSPTSSVRPTSIVSLKYSTPLTAATINAYLQRSAEVKPLVLSDTPPMDLHQFLDGTADRRSSTASLTDAGTRSSARARKLTTKAQALAGTNFLPSLQHTSDAEIPTIQPDLQETSVQETVEHETAEKPIEIEDSPRHRTPETATEETTPVESVETPSIRTSTRERKPTTRMIELETTKVTRKRLASPLINDRFSKLAKKSPSAGSKASKLRHSTINAEEVADIEGNVESTRPTELQATDNTAKNVTPIAESPSIPVINSITGSQESEPIAEVSLKSAQNQTLDQAVVSTLEEMVIVQSSAEEEKPDPKPCDLGCLSPSARLLAFAKLASEWSDADEDSDEEEHINFEIEDSQPDENSALLDMLRTSYCRCPDKVAESNSVALMNQTKVTNTTEQTRPLSVGPQKTTSPRRPPVRQIVKNPKTQAEKKHKILNKEGNVPQTRHRRAKPKTQEASKQNSGFEQRMQTDYLASQQLRMGDPKNSLQVNEKPKTGHERGINSAAAAVPEKPKHSHTPLTNGSQPVIANPRAPTEKSWVHELVEREMKRFQARKRMDEKAAGVANAEQQGTYPNPLTKGWPTTSKLSQGAKGSMNTNKTLVASAILPAEGSKKRTDEPKHEQNSENVGKDQVVPRAPTTSIKLKFRTSAK